MEALSTAASYLGTNFGSFLSGVACGIVFGSKLRGYVAAGLEKLAAFVR